VAAPPQSAPPPAVAAADGGIPSAAPNHAAPPPRHPATVPALNMGDMASALANVDSTQPQSARASARLSAKKSSGVAPRRGSVSSVGGTRGGHPNA
jgi:hypothetical protein